MTRSDFTALARKRKDIAALAVIEVGRRFVDEGPDRPVLRIPRQPRFRLLLGGPERPTAA